METLLTVVAAVGGVTIMVAVGIFGADWSELLTRGEQFIVGQLLVMSGLLALQGRSR